MPERADFPISSMSLRLDDWYRAINTIYLDRNFYRTPESIFAHLVEVMGGLSVLASEKKRPNVVPQQYVAKALAWWLALCGKVGVRSVEDMIWSKFPRVCSYCRLRVHKHAVCIQIKKGSRSPDWKALEVLAQDNIREKPRDMKEWQVMFGEIYEVVATEQFSATFARFTEELGELSEALRVFPVAPANFLGEAADVFAWLMHLQNLIESKGDVPSQERGGALTEAFVRSYPGGCKDRGNPICTCPPVLPSTLGRIGHEVPPNRASFVEGGAFFSVDEALRHFELRAREIRLADKSFPAGPDLIKEINSAVKELRELVLENNQTSGAVSVGLIDVLGRVESLTSSQRVTQESIENLARSIAEMPSETRSVVLGLLTNVAAAPWAMALVDFVHRLAAR